MSAELKSEVRESAHDDVSSDASLARARLFDGVLTRLPVVLFRLDADGRFTESMGYGLRRLGLVDHQVVGVNALDSFASARPHLERALAGETVVYEGAGKTPDGEPWSYLTYATVDAHHGNGAIAFAIDVTEQKAAEHALRQREAELRMLIDHSPDFVLRVDRDGTIGFVNRLASDRTRARLLGDSAFNFILPKHHDKLRRALAIVFDEGKLQQMELHTTPDIGGMIFDVRAHPIVDDDTITGSVWIARDITQQKHLAEQQAKMQEQLQQAQKLESLGLLAGGIAHDFNNLLMGVLGHASLAQMEMPPGSPGERRIHQIMETAERASELCQQLLAYSGKGRFVVGPIDISELVLGTARLLEVSVPKSVVLRYECAEQLPAVEADATQLRQIVMNLVVNAAEAIGNRSGMVTLSTGVLDCDAQLLRDTYLDDELVPGQYVSLEVSDNGCGMDETTRKQMFDPFFSTKMSGRGLGMAAVLGIVRGHNGALKVYSEPGKGTTIKVLLPVSSGEVTAASESEAPAEVASQQGLVLVVDDEEIVREVAAQTLMHSGYQVLTAADGEEALSHYRANAGRIRLVLLDLMMPNKSGTEVFDELRHLAPELPVILSSGYNEQDTTNRFAGKGLAGFIQKPYTAQQLRSLVNTILA